MSEPQPSFEEQNAERLQANFSYACSTLGAWIQHYDGVFPIRNHRAQEYGFQTTNAMISSVQAMQRGMAEHYAQPDIEALYRRAYQASYAQLQTVLSASYTRRISLGMFHDNLWLLAEQFHQSLDMSKVRPSTAMQRQKAHQDKIAAQVKPARPAGKAKPRDSQGQRSHTSRDAAPHFT